jgi:hypothetical protein
MPHPTRQQKTNYTFGNQFQELEKILELAVKMTMLCLTEVAWSSTVLLVALKSSACNVFVGFKYLPTIKQQKGT